jgi:hypothetical protein
MRISGLLGKIGKEAGGVGGAEELMQRAANGFASIEIEHLPCACPVQVRMRPLASVVSKQERTCLPHGGGADVWRLPM